MNAALAALVLSSGQLLLAAALPAAAGSPEEELLHPRRAVYLFNLSDFQGDVKGSFQRLAYDHERDEVYVWGGSEVQIFGETGMELHHFGSAQGVPSVYALAPLPSGDLIISAGGEQGAHWIRCNFRGEVIAPFTLSGLPAGIGAGNDAIRAIAGKLFFMDMRAFRMLATDEEGRYLFHRDLLKPVFSDLGPDADPDTENNDLSGFDVDGEGNVLLTVAAQFRALVISPNLKVRPFGGKGSRAGKFNIAGPITRDERGYFYVADLLRSVIMVFTPDLKFLFEFGGRGESPGRLVLPTSIAVGNGKVFVSQGKNRGVSVFKIEY